jgi:hypothetical protein
MPFPFFQVIENVLDRSRAGMLLYRCGELLPWTDATTKCVPFGPATGWIFQHPKIKKGSALGIEVAKVPDIQQY